MLRIVRMPKYKLSIMHRWFGKRCTYYKCTGVCTTVKRTYESRPGKYFPRSYPYISHVITTPCQNLMPLLFAFRFLLILPIYVPVIRRSSESTKRINMFGLFYGVLFYYYLVGGWIFCFFNKCGIDWWPSNNLHK